MVVVLLCIDQGRVADPDPDPICSINLLDYDIAGVLLDYNIAGVLLDYNIAGVRLDFCWSAIRVNCYWSDVVLLLEC